MQSPSILKMRLRKTFQAALFKTKTTDKFKIKLFKTGFAHSRIQPLNSTNIHFWHGAEDMREASRTGEDKVLRVGEGSDKVLTMFWKVPLERTPPTRDATNRGS